MNARTKEPKNHDSYTPDCPLCGHTGPKQVTHRNAEFCAQKNSITVFKCQSCHTIFTDLVKLEPQQQLASTTG